MKDLGDLEDRSSSSKEILQKASKSIVKHREDATKEKFKLSFYFMSVMERSIQVQN